MLVRCKMLRHPCALTVSLEAAPACTRAGIAIATFMLATAERLGEFLFADYIRNKRRTVY